jgi:starch phosphorylase
VSWPKVSIRRLDNPQDQIFRDETFNLKVAMYVDGLDPSDIVIDCLVGVPQKDGTFERHSCFQLEYLERNEQNEAIYGLSIMLAEPGKQCYMLRAYPFHPLLGQRFETGFMIWL